MIRILLATAILLTGSAVVTSEEVPTRASQAREVLRDCEASEELIGQPDKAWEGPKSALAEHEALRSVLNEPMPESPTRVLVFASGGHLATTQFSVVLEREDDGQWHGTAAGRSRIWVENAPYAPMDRKAWTLSAEKAERLDALLKGRCLYAEPSQFSSISSGPPPRGAMAMHLDIVTPEQRRSAAFLGGEAEGLTAEVMALVLPD